jgi:hypothetical protein
MMRAQGQDREEIAQARAHWDNDQREIPTAKLVFIDEIETTTQQLSLIKKKDSCSTLSLQTSVKTSSKPLVITIN